MTLVISSLIPEGVVVTADSRQTYVNRSNFPRIASDNATKIIQLTESVVVATSGNSFFNEAGKLKSIQRYLEDFRDSDKLKGAKTTLEMALALDTYCREWIERIVKESIGVVVAQERGSDLVFKAIANAKLPYEYKDAQGKPKNTEWALAQVSFIVAGRDADNSCHSISMTPFLGVGTHLTTPNVHWIGQGEVISKLFTGADGFVLSSATMTIQDAIDFAILLTRTTENIQKFSDGTLGSQGGIPGVGGPIDVVLVPRKGDLRWLSEKNLHTEQPKD